MDSPPFADATPPAETIHDLAVLAAPWGKEVTLRGVAYDGGLRMVRLRIRENKRFTDLELDEATARALAAALTGWFTPPPA